MFKIFEKDVELPSFDSYGIAKIKEDILSSDIGNYTDEEIEGKIEEAKEQIEEYISDKVKEKISSMNIKVNTDNYEKIFEQNEILEEKIIDNGFNNNLITQLLNKGYSYGEIFEISKISNDNDVDITEAVKMFKEGGNK